MAALDPELLLRAYSIGVFPMADSRDAEDVFWVEPKRRAILPLDRFRFTRSLRKAVRSDRFRVTRDAAFADVVRACADRPETWINPVIEQAYRALHDAGHAHSIECWDGDALAGGLYGVRLGGAFFGESMFSRRTDASKVALAWLVARLRFGGFTLLDCQFITDHLKSLGAIEIAQADYISLLSAATGGASSGASSGSGVGTVAGAAFGALDGLLDAAGPASASASPGWVIAQLLGQTS